MSSRPKISDKTIEKVQNWIDDNPSKGITATNKAIEYLVEKGLEKEDGLTDKQREAVEKIIEENLD
jgi:hypothetical protein